MDWNELKQKLINSKYYNYHTDNGVLLCGDCLEVMKELPEKSVDLVLTDPPYGKLKGSKSIGGGKLCNANLYDCSWDTRPSKNLMDLMFRVSKNQVIFGCNYLADILPLRNSLIVWDKKERNNWFDNFSDGEILWTSFDKPLRIFRFLWRGALRKGKRVKRIHPTQKPVELIVWILRDYLNKELDTINTVLDPFLGSGTTAVACEELNRRWIGIEISKEYCELSKERIKREISQRRLFKPGSNTV